MACGGRFGNIYVGDGVRNQPYRPPPPPPLQASAELRTESCCTAWTGSFLRDHCPGTDNGLFVVCALLGGVQHGGDAGERGAAAQAGGP